jgi:pyrroloquinoline-quinone synthase
VIQEVFANRKNLDGKTSRISSKSSIQHWIFRGISSSIPSVYFMNHSHRGVQEIIMPKNRPQKKNLLELLDSLIEEHHLLKHPFYRGWVEGTLPKESLQLYAEQYYQHVRAFPENLKQLASRTSGNLAGIVEENLAAELNPVAPHPMLWRHFAQSLGVSEAALDSSRPLPGIAALLDTYDEVASEGTTTQAVAAFYAYESQVPEIAAQKIVGLRRFYDITEPRALAYFAAHEEADVRHRNAWRGWLSSQNDAGMFGALCAAERGLKALWGALDAVYPHAFAARN